MANTPNVVVMCKYSLPDNGDSKRKDARSFYSSNKKDDYMGYIDKGATDEINHDLIDYQLHVIEPLRRTHPDDYMDYVGNKEKTKGVFSKDGYLSDDDKKKIRGFLRNTKGTIWDMVISTEDEYGKTHLFNDNQAMELLNDVLPKFFKSAKLNPKNVLWFAGLHENTDNRHIHLCFTELEPAIRSKVDNKYHFRKGKIDTKYFNELKLNIESHFDTTIEKQRIHSREMFKKIAADLIASTPEGYDLALKSLFKSLIDKLPKEGRKGYNSANMKPYIKDIDAVTTYILEHGKYSTSYFNLLSEISECDERTYKRCGIYNTSIEDKLIMPKFQKDLYSRLGNVIIEKVIEERDIAYKAFQHIKNENFRRKQEIKSLGNLLIRTAQIAEQVDKEALETYLEYEYKMKEIECKRLKDEMEAEAEM